MIETPDVDMISNLLIKEMDFFSICTNDLIQYTLAIDCQTAKIANIYNSHHEAVLRMIQMIVDSNVSNCSSLSISISAIINSYMLYIHLANKTDTCFTQSNFFG